MKLFLRLKLEIEQNKPDLFALLFLAGWPFVFFWPATLRQVVFIYGDILLFFYPTHLAYANALREGRLPLWEPNILAGFPLLAEGQIGAFYPLHPILYGLLPIDIATNYDILFHVAWVAVGTYLFARAIKLQIPSSFLAAFCFATGGFFFARLQHMSVLATASWLPWLLWAWEKHEEETDKRKRLRWIVVLAAMSGIQLFGGHPQFAFSSALLICIYSVVRWKRETNPPPLELLGRKLATPLRQLFDYFSPSRLIPVLFFFVIGAAIAAVQLFPMFELAGFTNRASGLDARFFNAFSLRALHYLMLINPFLPGNPWPHVSVEVIGYVGLLTLLLAFASPFVRRDRRVTFFLLIAFVALFLGLGDLNFFYRALRHLPLFNYFRVPSRFLYWFTFAAPMLAAISFDYFLSRAPVTARVTSSEKFVLALFAMAIAIAVGLVPWVPLSFWLSIWVWLPLATALFSVWIILGARRGLFSRTTLVALVLGLVVLDLSAFGAVYANTYDSTTPVADFYRAPDVVPVLKGLSPQEGRTLTSTWIIPWQLVEKASFYPNVALSYGIPSAIGYTPLIPQLTSDYIEQMTAQMFNLMNIRYYVIPQMLPTTPETEGEDLHNPFSLDPISRDIPFAPTVASKIRIISSVAQSAAWHTGDKVADIYLVTQDGETIDLALRAGLDTAEWAYERSDVRRAMQYPLPAIATTFPASSSFPVEQHEGHAYLSELPLSMDGQPRAITGLYIYPQVDPGLVHIESVTLVSPTGAETSVASLVGRDDQKLVYRTNLVAVYENPNPLPRAFLIHNAHVADDQSAEYELARDDYKPKETLILASGQPIDSGHAQLPEEQVRIESYEKERVVLSVKAAKDGYLFMSDSWYPGWNARVDGTETPVLRGDLIFRAIRVSPGEHHIEMEYRPTSLYLGAVVSIFALVLVAGLAIAGFRR